MGRKRKAKKRHPILFLMGLGFLFSMGGLISLTIWAGELPGFSQLKKNTPLLTAFMKYREKSGIYGRPIWIPLNRIAPELKHAVIVAEDARFYYHHGMDWAAIWHAQKKNIKERRLYRGGSTITQQLAKNLYLEPSKTVLRKVKEMAVTLRLEQSLSKHRIFEIYLNVVEWGRGIYGAEAASRHYFGKSAAHLTLMEASWLAAILPSPLRYEKDRDSQYARERALWVSEFVKGRLEK